MPTALDRVIVQLNEDLVSRHVDRGLARLAEHESLLRALDPRQHGAGVLVGCLAQWVDVGLRRQELLKELVSRFGRELTPALALADYVYVRFALGLLEMAAETSERAVAHFDFVLQFSQELDDQEFFSITNFWKGRCLRQKGEYDESLRCTEAGRDLALKCGHPRMAAVMRVLESWLLFQKGKHTEAVQILKEAEKVLRETDDYITLGNICSSYGRIAQRQGRYQQAITHFSEAIGEYKKRDPQHRNVARSLANMAYCKRLIALQLLKKIDAAVERRRKGAGPGKNSFAGTPYRKRFEELRREAFAELDEAAEIYKLYPTRHGAGSVQLAYGYLHLDSGDLEDAEERAAAAYALGERKKDHILMARARILECTIENARIEEGIGEGTDPGSHARAAQARAQEALDLAQHTQNRQLLADAYVWQGLTWCNSFFDDTESAQRCYDLASGLWKGTQPEAWQDIQTLKAKILRSGSVDSNLRSWSQGSVGDKSFEKLTEEFEDLIIPKIWEREGRKVARVATRLAMSPKRIRRILDRAGKRK